MSLNIYAVNESSLSANEAWNIAWACDYQLRYHFGRSGWRSDVRCIFVPSPDVAKIPVGSAILHFIDTLDVQGALGYHDEDGNEVPFARVGVKTTQQDGGQVSEVASHEALELAADPNVYFVSLTGDLKRIYALEVGDPVQGSAYDVGALEGRATGIVVANFALPPYFDPNTKAEKVDFRGVLSAPFTIAPQGYMSYIDTTNMAGGWQQVLGHERTGPPPPDRDDRHAQRLATVTA